ncbi:uncharacterized protein LOC133305175 [Gastrolobium bilobum]|uniref:uncharacterized protein LOC133305175 n=1 Tax=Gastrolobium bilobum TaxID=150636 RepID=UPI002AAF3A54|nr:uncharacterized protein LOC133305175 [Gastrolobium bilobum]
METPSTRSGKIRARSSGSSSQSEPVPSFSTERAMQRHEIMLKRIPSPDKGFVKEAKVSIGEEEEKIKMNGEISPAAAKRIPKKADELAQSSATATPQKIDDTAPHAEGAEIWEKIDERLKKIEKDQLDTRDLQGSDNEEEEEEMEEEVEQKDENMEDNPSDQEEQDED